MNPTCGNELASEDYIDIISRYRTDVQELYRLGVPCVNTINDIWAVLTYPREAAPEISYRIFSYFRLPKLYTTTDMTSMEASGVTRLFSNPTLNNTGKNVLVGIVDTGIDYAHPVFRNRQGKTRIKAIWDQTAQSQPDNSETDSSANIDVEFGRVYYEDEINAALESENPYDVIPGDRESMHGTFMAGIAAGNFIEGEFTGAAPDAMLVVVKLKEAKQFLRDFYLIKEDAVAFSETDIMFGVKFLNMIASKMSRPLVVLLGTGTTYGPHTGQTPLGDYLEEVATQMGTVVVTPTGNEGNGRRHYYGNTSGIQPQTVEINVGAAEKGFMLELWGENPDVYTVEFVSPSGETVPRIPAYLDGSSEITFVFEDTTIHVDYSLVEEVSGRHLVAMRFENPTEGVWKINVYGSRIVRGIYNMWLPMADFLSSDTYFLSSNPDITLTAASAGTDLLSVSAYDHYTGAVFIDSGRGFSANGVVKPDIVAPGVNVYGPVGSGRFARRSGTSIAAAHVAGCAALLLDWGIMERNLTYMNTSVIKNLLIRGADRENGVMYPNRSWGYGTLNIFQVFETLRRE